MIIDAYDENGKGIVKSSMMYNKNPMLPDTAIVVFQNRITAEVTYSPKYNATVCDAFTGGEDKCIYVINGKNKKFTFYQSTIGAPVTVMDIEQAHAKGIRKFLFIGSCGILNDDIESNKFIIPTEAYRDEGTSYHYCECSDYIKIPTANKLANILDDLKIPYIKTKTWTTDAIFRETPSNMGKRKKEGCGVVEMECAAIMAAAKYLGIEIYQLLFPKDSLSSNVWDRNTCLKAKTPQDIFDTAILIAEKI